MAWTLTVYSEKKEFPTFAEALAVAVPKDGPRLPGAVILNPKGEPVYWNDDHLDIQLTARIKTKMSQKCFDTMLRNYNKWVAEGKPKDDAAMLAAFQARQATWMEQIGEPRRQKERELKAQEKEARRYERSKQAGD